MSEYDSGIFSGTLKSKYDEVEQLAPGFAKFSALAADTVSNYMKKNISSKKAALRLNILRCLDATGVEWTIGASTGAWYKRAYGSNKWEVSSPPTPKTGDALPGDWLKLREITPEDFSDTTAAYELGLLSGAEPNQGYDELHSGIDSTKEEVPDTAAETFNSQSYEKSENNTLAKNKYYADDETPEVSDPVDNIYFNSVLTSKKESGYDYVTAFSDSQEELSSSADQTDLNSIVAPNYAQSIDYTGSSIYLDDDAGSGWYNKEQAAEPEPTKAVFYDPASALEEALAALKNSNVEQTADTPKISTDSNPRSSVPDSNSNESDTIDE